MKDRLDYYRAGIEPPVEPEQDEGLLTPDVLGSPLWRPLHDILIDWNEGRIKLEGLGLPDLTNKIAKGENNIKAVKQMVKIVAKAQLAHTLNRFREALVQSREGKPLGLSEKEFELFSAIQSDATAKDNQKIEELFKEIERRSSPMNTNMFGISLEREEWQSLKDKYPGRRSE